MNVPAGLSFRASGPYYWMHETSGKMKEIVMKFLENESLNLYELEVLRWYFYQWIAAMPSKPDDFSKVLLMTQEELKFYNMDLLNKYGIDPL
jgi:hypothetical protein